MTPEAAAAPTRSVAAMRVSSALVCDAATVREGLLHILGGGITRLWREQLPAPLGVTIALMIAVGHEELGTPIDVRLVLTGPDGATVLEVRGTMETTGRLEAGETQLAPMVLPVAPVQTEIYGRYSGEITLNGRVQPEDITFWVLHPVEQHLPSL